MRLHELNPGDVATVSDLLASGSMRRRLLDIGLVKHTVVTCIGKAPLGDPAAYCIRGAVIALRAQDAATVAVQRQQGGADNGAD